MSHQLVRVAVVLNMFLFLLLISACSSETIVSTDGDSAAADSDRDIEPGDYDITEDSETVEDGDTSTDGDTTDGDTTDGDKTDGDTTDGDTTDGDTTDGDTTDGDTTDGDTTDGDTTDGDAADGDATDGDTTDGDMVDGDTPTDGDADPEPCNGCLINNVCIPNRQVNSEMNCAYCNKAEDPYNWSPRLQGTVCRAAVGECDLQETCTGSSLECPADGYKESGSNCGGAGSACVKQDSCNDHGVCVDNGFMDNGTLCGSNDQCVGGTCLDCFNINGCDDFVEDINPCTDLACNNHVCTNVNDNNNTCMDFYSCTDNACSNGACVVSDINSGCFISNVCLLNGAIKGDTGSDQCKACVAGASQTGWTSLNTGSCDDANDCTYNDSCFNGICSGTYYACNSHGDCDGEGACDCDIGYTGNFCNQCIEGYTGYPNCVPESTPGFVPVSAGSFWMGSPTGSCPSGYPGTCSWEPGRDSDEELHHVTLTYDYEVSQYEVTEGEFEDLMGWNPNMEWDEYCENGCGDDHPVKFMSWYDTLAFANRMSILAGLTPCYALTSVTCYFGGDVGSNYMRCYDQEDSTYDGISSATVALYGGLSKPQDCEGYRLLTESEWEYAIRAGDQYTALYQSEGNDGTITNPIEPPDPNLLQIAWCGGNNTPYGTKAVGGLEPNAWGLYDMSGNLWELTWDWYEAEYEEDSDTDPIGPSTGTSHVMRGGFFKSSAMHARSASRAGMYPYDHKFDVGFRICRTIP